MRWTASRATFFIYFDPQHSNFKPASMHETQISVVLLLRKQFVAWHRLSWRMPLLGENHSLWTLYPFFFSSILIFCKQYKVPISRTYQPHDLRPACFWDIQNKFHSFVRGCMSDNMNINDAPWTNRWANALMNLSSMVKKSIVLRKWASICQVYHRGKTEAWAL